MKCNMDNLRIKLAHSYNRIANICKTVSEVEDEGGESWYELPDDLFDDLEVMRDLIGALLLCYNDIDTNDVSDKVELVSIYGDEDD